jgi:hypothetical protein
MYDASSYKRYKVTKSIKKAVHTVTPSFLNQFYVHKKLNRSDFLFFMKTPQLKKWFTKILTVVSEFEIHANEEDWFKLVTLEVRTNDIDLEVLRVLKEIMSAHVVFKIVLKEELKKTKCYCAYDESENVWYVSDWWKEVIFRFSSGKSNKENWDNILEAMKKEGRRVW